MSECPGVWIGDQHPVEHCCEKAVAEREVPLASRMFDAYIEHGVLEERMDDAIGDAMNDTFSWGYLSYDYYDESVEFKCAENGATLSLVQQAALWKLGFSRTWVCRKDGSEIYYSPKCPLGQERCAA